MTYVDLPRQYIKHKLILALVKVKFYRKKFQPRLYWPRLNVDNLCRTAHSEPINFQCWLTNTDGDTLAIFTTNADTFV